MDRRFKPKYGTVSQYVQLVVASALCTSSRIIMTIPPQNFWGVQESTVGQKWMLLVGSVFNLPNRQMKLFGEVRIIQKKLNQFLLFKI